MCKKLNLDKDHTSFTKKINSKWIIDLNVKHKTMKVMEDNTEENPKDHQCGNKFLDLTPKI